MRSTTDMVKKNYDKEIACSREISVLEKSDESELAT